MWFKYLRVFYLNVTMIICISLNLPVFFFLVFLIKSCYVIWKSSFEQFNFLNIRNEIDDEWLVHIDYDTDSTFYFKLLKSEYYLWFNCHFFFSLYGGETILNELDFLDIMIYDTFDLRNLKYIYKDIYYKEIYNKEDYFFLYQFDDIYLKEYNLKRNLKLLNSDTFNILNNSDNFEKLNNKKKYYYIKRKC